MTDTNNTDTASKNDSPAPTGTGVWHTHRQTMIAAAIVAVGAVGLAGLYVGTRNADLDSREQARGVTEVVTVPSQQAGADGSVAAVPRPNELPPLIESSGECKTALNGVRDLIDSIPSGLSPRTPEQDQALTTALSRVGGAGGTGACSPEIAAAFRAQELAPWLTWAPPATSASPAAAPPTPAPTTAKKK